MNISSEKQLFLKQAKNILKTKGFKVKGDRTFIGNFGFVLLVEDQDGSELAAKVISLNNYS